MELTTVYVLLFIIIMLIILVFWELRKIVNNVNIIPQIKKDIDDTYWRNSTTHDIDNIKYEILIEKINDLSLNLEHLTSEFYEYKLAYNDTENLRSDISNEHTKYLKSINKKLSKR